jgi:thiamine transporter ThiT
MYVIITKSIKTYFKFLKILTSLQRKILRYFSHIVGGVYFPGSAAMFLSERYTPRLLLFTFMVMLCSRLDYHK